MIDVVGIVFAVLVAIGGIIGYLKAGSIPSLVAGIVFGVLLAIGAYFNSRTEPIPLIQIILLVVLGTMMGFRWVRSGNFMPPGLITVLSVAVLIWTCVMYRESLPFVTKPKELVDAASEKIETSTTVQ
ncbi:transmembrane protein 14 homolog [Uranotaenia lowii]|uniref:transmembrane protein 14 homolog n=1 Tax=Uranotaenia lowii TaxID=190385 RepID=UPI002478EA3F|nr:transmembrane protein 14 homolog [Uranotaenia lowii]